MIGLTVAIAAILLGLDSMCGTLASVGSGTAPVGLRWNVDDLDEAEDREEPEGRVEQGASSDDLTLLSINGL